MNTSTIVTDRTEEWLLRIDEAAQRLACSRDWLYRHWKQLPFARRMPYGVRFSANGIDAYIRQKK